MPRSDDLMREDARNALGIINQRLRRFQIEMTDLPPGPIPIESDLIKYRICDRGNLRLTMRDASEAPAGGGSDRELTLQVSTHPMIRDHTCMVGLNYLIPIDFPDMVGERVWELASDSASLVLLMGIDPDLAPFCDYFNRGAHCYEEHARLLYARVAKRLSVHDRIAPNSPFYTGKVLDAMLSYFAQQNLGCSEIEGGF